MNPKDFRMLMFGLLSVAMERDKQAHLTSVNELVALCPEAGKLLRDAHKRYLEHLDGELEKARALIEEPLVDKVDKIDDPGWGLLAYLIRDEPQGDQALDIVRISDAIRKTFGQPVSDPPKRD